MQRQVFMTEREVETVERKDEIVSGKTFLGIEFGSTRIKAVLTDADHTPIASGSHEWETAWITESGPIPWMTSGAVCRIATGI